jgi:nucleotide-binding universal stress UspA family protein
VIRTVLLPLDGSELSDQILGQVSRILDAQDVGVVSLLHVVPPSLDFVRSKKATQIAEDHLARVRTHLSGKSIPASLNVVTGDAAEAILAHIAEHSPDLVAMATHARSGVESWIRGSVAERVLHHSQSPVLLCTPAALAGELQAPFQRILVPLDGSEEALRILPLVKEMARLYESEVLLLRVANLAHQVEDGVESWTAEQVAETLEPARAQLEAAGTRVRVISKFGDPVDEIRSALEEHQVDLLMLSTHGRSGVSRWWYGSVSSAVLQQCPCPVLLRRVRPGEQPAA